MDSQPGAEYDQISTIAKFSPDGSHTAYVASKVTKSRKMLVVVDGQAGPEYDLVDSLVSFSPDGKHVAYMAGTAAKNGATMSMVMDGQMGAAYAVVLLPVFNPDNSMEFLAVKDSSLFRVKYTPAQVGG